MHSNKFHNNTWPLCIFSLPSWHQSVITESAQVSDQQMVHSLCFWSFLLIRANLRGLGAMSTPAGPQVSADILIFITLAWFCSLSASALFRNRRSVLLWRGNRVEGKQRGIWSGPSPASARCLDRRGRRWRGLWSSSPPESCSCDQSCGSCWERLSGISRTSSSPPPSFCSNKQTADYYRRLKVLESTSLTPDLAFIYICLLKSGSQQVHTRW